MRIRLLIFKCMDFRWFCVVNHYTLNAHVQKKVTTLYFLSTCCHIIITKALCGALQGRLSSKYLFLIPKPQYNEIQCATALVVNGEAFS